MRANNSCNAYVGFDERAMGYQNHEISVMDVSGGHPKFLTSKLDRYVDSPVWAANGSASRTSMALTTDLPVEDARYLIGALPWEDFESYWRHSPLSLAANVQTPTLLIVGDQDLPTPVGEAMQFYRALQFRGVPTVLIEVPGASRDSLAGRPSHSRHS
jgi:pimeloyl-ACP methyl ester carboxylesterase